MYYAIATNENGKLFLIDNLSDDRLEARIKAEQYCTANDLTLDGVYKYGNARAGGGILYKFQEHRKRHGELPERYFEVW